jgi:hypothetical protein
MTKYSTMGDCNGELLCHKGFIISCGGCKFFNFAIAYISCLYFTWHVVYVEKSISYLYLKSPFNQV